VSPISPEDTTLSDVKVRKWLKAEGRKIAGRSAKRFANNVKVVL